MALPNLAQASPWGAVASAAADIAKTGVTSGSGDIAGFVGGISPVSIAGFGSSATASADSSSIPPWLWIAAAAVAVLFLLRKK